MSPSRAPRLTAPALAAIVAVGLWLRCDAASGRELWYDDLGRLRLAQLSWAGIVERLHQLDNLKSPYLVGLHKLWVESVGAGSILAVRGFGIVLGTALAPAAYAVARRAAGAPVALGVAAWFAVNPFFVRWSVEVHNYAPAALLALAFHASVPATDPPGRRRMAGLGALAGAAVGVFPPVAAALLPSVVAPSLRRCRDVAGWAVAAATCAVTALPSLVSMRASAETFAPAITEGRAWSPYFNPLKTPFEVAARMAGLDVRQGASTRAMAVAAALVVLLAVACTWLDPDRRGDRAAWSRRVSLLVSGLLPAVVLVAVSVAWIGVLNDRYAHAALVMLPLGLVVAAGAALRGGPAGKAGGALLLLTLGGAVLHGFTVMRAQGATFPRDLTARSYACAALVDRLLAAGPPPDAILVHGESQASMVIDRSTARARGVASVRHLTTTEWLHTAASPGPRRVAVPIPYGSPYVLGELYGAPVSVDRTFATALVRENRRFWLVMEHPVLVRTYDLESEEVVGGLDEAFRLLAEPSSPDRDAAATAAVARHLAVPPEFRVAVVRSGRAAVFTIEPR